MPRDRDVVGAQNGGTIRFDGSFADIDKPARRNHSDASAQPDLAIPIHERAVGKKMATINAVTKAGLRTPSAAAIAGLLFSLLVIAAFWLIRGSVPEYPQEPGAWLCLKWAIAGSIVPRR